MVDIIAVLKSESVEKISLSNADSQFLLIEPGRKVEAESITSHIGGGAMNTAVCFSRLGCEAVPMVKVGDDSSRDSVIAQCEHNELSKAGILTHASAPTGSAVLIASHEKNAAIFTQRGANTTLSSADVDMVPVSPDLVHAGPLSGNSAAALPAISQMARRAGAFFSSNPGIRQITMRANSVLTAAADMALLSLNHVEASALIPCLSALHETLEWGDPKGNEPVLDSGGGPVPLKRFFDILHTTGAENIVVTFGSDGAWFSNGSELFHQPIIETDVASTAGAGDSFVSTLAWAIKSGNKPDTALSLAAHNASSVVSHVNTTDGLLNREKLLKKIS